MASLANIFEDGSDSDRSFDGFHESDLDSNIENQLGNYFSDNESDIDVSSSDSDENSGDGSSAGENSSSESEEER